MSFVDELQIYARKLKKHRLRIREATVAVTEPYARRVLRIGKDSPLRYRGLRLRCIGSKKWRYKQTEV